jgi:hypothetical protein
VSFVRNYLNTNLTCCRWRKSLFHSCPRGRQSVTAHTESTQVFPSIERKPQPSPCLVWQITTIPSIHHWSVRPSNAVNCHYSPSHEKQFAELNKRVPTAQKHTSSPGPVRRSAALLRGCPRPAKVSHFIRSFLFDPLIFLQSMVHLIWFDFWELLLILAVKYRKKYTVLDTFENSICMSSNYFVKIVSLIILIN